MLQSPLQKNVAVCEDALHLSELEVHQITLSLYHHVLVAVPSQNRAQPLLQPDVVKVHPVYGETGQL